MRIFEVLTLGVLFLALLSRFLARGEASILD